MMIPQGLDAAPYVIEWLVLAGAALVLAIGCFEFFASLPALIMYEDRRSEWLAAIEKGILYVAGCTAFFLLLRTFLQWFEVLRG